MKLSTINLAITYALSRPDGLTPSQIESILEIRDQIVELKLSTNNSDTDATIASNCTITDLLNVSTYDVVGKMFKTYKDKRSSKPLYKRYCQSHFPGLTDSQIDDAFEFLLNLWLENEEEGNNNIDGTYNKNNFPY